MTQLSSNRLCFYLLTIPGAPQQSLADERFDVLVRHANRISSVVKLDRFTITTFLHGLPVATQKFPKQASELRVVG